MKAMLNQLAKLKELGERYLESRSKFTIGVLADFAVGIFLGESLPLERWWLLGISIGIAIALLIFWKDLIARFSLLLLLSLMIGVFFLRSSDAHQRQVALPWGNEQIFQGQISAYPDFSGATAEYLVKFNGTKIKIICSRFPEYGYGDTLQFKGTLKKSSDYDFYQGIQGVVYQPQDVEVIGRGGRLLTKALFAIRSRFERSLGQSFNEPYASFAAGLVLGSKGNLPDSLLTAFNRAGVTHIIAVSGYNVTIIIVNIGILLGLLSRKLKFWGSLILIVGFVVMTGAAASVVRAGLLAALVAWGQFEGRRINLTILLLLVAGIMLIFNPYALRHDISFQLSFLAFAGLIYLSPVISEWKIVRILPRAIKTALSETLAAQTLVLPILIYYFGRMSLVAPLANVLILWLIPLTMFLIFMVGLSGMICLKLGWLFGGVTWFLLRYIIIVVESFAHFHWASWELKLGGWWWMVLFYGALIWLIYKFRPEHGEVKNAQSS